MSPPPVFSKSNQELFRADVSSDEWKAYVEYIDDMVIDGFFNSIECSLKFFLENTGDTFMTSVTSRSGPGGWGACLLEGGGGSPTMTHPSP